MLANGAARDLGGLPDLRGDDGGLSEVRETGGVSSDDIGGVDGALAVPRVAKNSFQLPLMRVPQSARIDPKVLNFGRVLLHVLDPQAAMREPKSLAVRSVPSQKRIKSWPTCL